MNDITVNIHSPLRWDGPTAYTQGRSDGSVRAAWHIASIHNMAIFPVQGDTDDAPGVPKDDPWLLAINSVGEPVIKKGHRLPSIIKTDAASYAFYHSQKAAEAAIREWMKKRRQFFFWTRVWPAIAALGAIAAVLLG